MYSNICLDKSERERERERKRGRGRGVFLSMKKIKDAYNHVSFFNDLLMQNIFNNL